MVRLVMLDRDGVLNEDRADYVKNPGELVMIPGAARAVARLNEARIPVALVSNQSAVGRGLITAAALDRIQEHLVQSLSRERARLDAVFVCTDPPWAATDRRKPGPGMLREALARFRAPAAESVMIGDSLRDMEAAKTAGTRRILVRTGQGATTQKSGLLTKVLPLSVYNDLESAVDALLTESGDGGG
jgi:D-glycero-D-manno-heptose 1,7-bisphosphate phosphatase